MDAVELLRAYPTIPHAVAYVELFVCVPPDDEPQSAWQAMMQSGIGPGDVARCIQFACEDTEQGDVDGRWAEARAEMDRPEFLTYIRGKMGAM